jgi:ABC-type lipoprotein release transport system permease subunit
VSATDAATPNRKIATAAIATLLPARSSTRIDPVIALRTES